MRGGIIILSRFWKLILKMCDERTDFKDRGNSHTGSSLSFERSRKGQNIYEQNIIKMQKFCKYAHICVNK